MRQYIKLWIATIAVLLCNAANIHAEDYHIYITTDEGPLGTQVQNERNNIPQYEYTSSTHTLEKPSNVLYFKFLEGYTTNQYQLDKNGYPFVALAEFQLFDADGKEIKLGVHNFSTNAPERFEGPIADICDGNRCTHFHTTWSSGASDFHYLRVALPDTLSAFSFKYYTRNTAQCVPKTIVIASEYCEDPYIHEDPYAQVLAQGTCGENVSWTLKYGGHLMISGEGDMKIQSYDSPWEKLGIARVTIEDGVTSICDRAFCDCSSLTSVSIPTSVTKIGRDYSYSQANPFSGCNSLNTIEINENNPAFDSRDNCNAIIQTGDNTLIVGCYTTRIPESVVSIEEEAFYNCRELKTLNIPKSVAAIKQGAFDFCNLTTITIDKENPVYDSRDNCNAIIETRSNTLVLGCINTVIPTNVEKIGNKAFESCWIDSVVIPGSVTSIGEAAFSYSRLSYISIPKSVKDIATNAFNGCLELSAIVIDANNEIYDSRNNCNAIIETATNTLIQGCLSTVIPNGVTKIGNRAFYSLGLTSVVIPQSVSEIGNEAFSGCRNLAPITISMGATKIGVRAFSGTAITSIIIPKSVTEIGEEAFAYCRKLTTATLPKKMEGSAMNIFKNCDNLTTIRYKNINKIAKPYKDWEYVDLGLPSRTLWATQNLGAKNPYETGYYLAWGETKKKSTYSLKTYFDKRYEKFDTNSNPYLSGTEYDAATALWGEGWMMPTYEQANELYKYCTWEWTDNYNGSNVAGCICTGPNGKHIFFPSGGLMMDKKHAYTDYGNYWVGSLYRFNNIDWANFIDFNKNGPTQKYVSRDHRYWGRNVRAVRKDKAIFSIVNGRMMMAVPPPPIAITQAVR